VKNSTGVQRDFAMSCRAQDTIECLQQQKNVQHHCNGGDDG
jgi:hypothetical protein